MAVVLSLNLVNLVVDFMARMLIFDQFLARLLNFLVLISGALEYSYRCALNFGAH